jgi:hypothetical protein
LDTKKNSMASVRKRTIPTERPPLFSEDSANFFADRGCHVVSVTNPYGRILGFLDQSRYCFFQVAPHLYSRGWVDPIPDPLLFFLVVPGNRIRGFRICSQELWTLDHRGGLDTNLLFLFNVLLLLLLLLLLLFLRSFLD